MSISDMKECFSFLYTYNLCNFYFDTSINIYSLLLYLDCCLILPIFTVSEMSQTLSKHLLVYMITIFNGDHNLMIEKAITLTWLEEWIFFFECLQGRTLTRWWDATVAMKTSKKAVIKVFWSKLRITNAACSSCVGNISVYHKFLLLNIQ